MPSPPPSRLSPRRLAEAAVARPGRVLAIWAGSDPCLLAGDATSDGARSDSLRFVQPMDSSRSQVPLADVGIGAARTRGGAVDAGLDTAHDHIAIATGRLRMRLEHLSNRHLPSFRRPGGGTGDHCRVQSRYSSLRQARRSSASGFGVRASRNEWYGAAKGSPLHTLNRPFAARIRTARTVAHPRQSR
jgi:hypothetical protein